jgi:hypothetical protein
VTAPLPWNSTVVPSSITKLFAVCPEKWIRIGQSMTRAKALFLAALNAAAVPWESSVPSHFTHALIDLVARVPTIVPPCSRWANRGLQAPKGRTNLMANCLVPGELLRLAELQSRSSSVPRRHPPR